MPLAIPKNTLNTSFSKIPIYCLLLALCTVVLLIFLDIFTRSFFATSLNTIFTLKTSIKFSGLWILAYKGIAYLSDMHQCLNTHAANLIIVFGPVTYSVLLSGITLFFDIKMLMFIRARSKIGPIQMEVWGTNNEDDTTIPLRSTKDVINATIPIKGVDHF